MCSSRRSVLGFVLGGGLAHLDVEAELGALALNDGGQVVHRELLRELVVHAHLPIRCRVVNRQLDALHLTTAIARASTIACSTGLS